jgi:hypothetical protein
VLDRLAGSLARTLLMIVHSPGVMAKIGVKVAELATLAAATCPTRTPGRLRQPHRRRHRLHHRAVLRGGSGRGAVRLSAGVGSLAQTIAITGAATLG